jgi:hypothetical protein
VIRDLKKQKPKDVSLIRFFMSTRDPVKIINKKRIDGDGSVVGRLGRYSTINNKIACLGVGIALMGILAVQITNNTIYDGIASLGMIFLNERNRDIIGKCIIIINIIKQTFFIRVN